MKSHYFSKPGKLKIALSVFIFFCAFKFSFSQQLLIDSLLQRKHHLESNENFVKTDTNYIKTLYVLAKKYAQLNKDSTNSIATEALRLSKAIKYEKGIAGSKLALGLSKIFEGKFQLGFKEIEEVKNTAEKINADTIYLNSLNAIGMGHFMNADYAKSYKYSQIGIKKSKELNNHEMSVRFNMNLATSFAILDDPQQALSYYKECLNLLKTKNDELGLAQVKSNMGYLFVKTKEVDKAKKHLEESIKFFKENINKPWQAFVQINLGELSILEKKYDSAIVFFNDSKKLLRNVYDPQRKAEACLGLAEVYLLKNELYKSKENAINADSISKSINFYEGSIRAKKLLYQLFKIENQTEKAVAYLEASQHLSDSIAYAENKTKLLMLEAQTNFEQEQSRIEAENKKKLERQKAITYIAIILLISTGIILFLIRKNIITQKKANKELIEINQIKDKIFSIVGHDLKAPINTMQELLELYKNEAITPQQIAEITPRLKNNVDHSAFTLNNLLFWAQTQMNGIKVVPERINLKNVVNNICELYQEQLKKKNISIECNISQQTTVFIDKEHLNIILRNVVSNAIKYSHLNQKITFNAIEDIKTIKISICDEGIGMTKGLINNVLTGKSITSIPGTQNEKGTGLGLNICKDLLVANKGSLTIQSQSNQGTCFHITLPSKQNIDEIPNFNDKTHNKL
ncbi:tetratricopeptide repeat-containing sensor histidine kinase [Croceitalea rosinachiae]|uniref:histidine kinase n=1 Tax=Croceitalea rosinachiae TaxID=3075596 RepID=A0ABU3AE19_9FLAO|nr:tetratricopeptide repeat-containing sensor histidine kinase [Croceitalea sp. F388]MDT0607348.1 tetratricopeptide repeat-containing sensor histidine kinase [Croceitalea sp. F388]